MTLGSNSCMTVLAAIILLVPKIGVNGSTIVDMVREKREFSAFIGKMNDGLSDCAPLLEDGKIVDCMGNSKTCISLCCELTEARQNGNCVNDDSRTPRNLKFIDDNGDEENISEENQHPCKNDPCTVGWMTSYIKENFKIFKNGSIYVLDYDEKSVWSLGQYCLMWDKESYRYLAKVCRPWVRQHPCEIWCATFAGLVMILIFVVFTIVPELRNFHGLLFRCYVATYIGIYVCALGVEYTTETRANDWFFTVLDISARYLGLSSAMWLNVMSFNIWRSFRSLRPTIRHNFKERRRKEFVWYALYAWGGPIVLFSIAVIIMNYVPYFQKDTYDKAVKQWGSVAIVSVALLCNVVLHILTALNIRKQEKDVAHLTNGVDKHYAINKQWFNMYLKLFVIMGAHMVTWPIWLIWPRLVHVLGTFEVAQSIFIFVIFAWKDNVKRSLGIRLMRFNASSIWMIVICRIRANTTS